jgi:transcriptional regulator with XRE-family HTH domain
VDGESEPFVRWLTEQVRSAGISQREASRRAGLSDNAVNDYLHARRLPLPAACRGLAHAFGVAEDVVLALAGHRAPLDAPIDGEFFAMLREQPADLLNDIERWVRPFVRAYWEQRQPERAPRRPDLSIQLRWDSLE